MSATLLGCALPSRRLSDDEYGAAKVRDALRRSCELGASEWMLMALRLR